MHHQARSQDFVFVWEEGCVCAIKMKTSRWGPGACSFGEI